jgi:glycosyltransferase involved in cell wall biosynthesis
MRILLLDQFSELGGAQRMALSTLDAIHAAGGEAFAALPGDGPLFREIERIGIETAQLCCGPFSLGGKSMADVARFARQLPGLVRQIKTLSKRFRPNLAFINGPRLLPAVALADLGIPTLFHSHSYLPAGITRHTSGHSLRTLDATVIGCCRFVVEPWRAYAPSGRVGVVFNGVAGPVTWTHRRRSPVPRIGCIGRISPEKGQLEFLRAATAIHQELPTSRFVIYGAPMFSPDSHAYAERVRAAAHHLPVEFPGWVSDVSAALTNLDLLLVPSIGPEATTRVVPEAFAAGVPVVAFRTGGIPEVIDDGRTGFLVANAEEMAQQAISLLSDDLAWSRVSRAARKSWDTQFRIERFQEEILRAIENAVNGTPISTRNKPAETTAITAAPPMTRP